MIEFMNRRAKFGCSQRLGLSVRHLRRWQRRVEAEGDRGWMPRRRGMLSNRKMAPEKQARILTRVGARYGDFGPTLAQEKLGGEGLEVSREPLRQWRMAAGLGKARRQRVSAGDVWRERRRFAGHPACAAQPGHLLSWPLRRLAL